MAWPKKCFSWVDNRTLYISIPFTWELPKAMLQVQQRSFLWDQVVVGGPAVYLMPGYFQAYDYVTEGRSLPGILQQINPLATRTTLGCIRRCKFCGVRDIEGDFVELDDWPDLPIICDNNLLAASVEHFDRVIGRLVEWKWADFNQGIDARLLTEHHAKRLAEIKKPTIRLALDSMAYQDQWSEAFSLLRSAGIAKSNIRTYALIGFDSDPDEAWQRCEWVEQQGGLALPMWFHPLHTLKKNQVTQRQAEMGWNDYERRRIMKWYYWHQKVKQ